MIVIVKRDWGVKDIAKSYEDPGRKKGKPSGSYIDDLVALKKAVILCDSCLHKFNAERAKYEKPARYSTVRAKCDDCREFGFGTLFLAATKLPR
jgi:hypothetical protein